MASRKTLFQFALVAFAANLAAWVGVGIATRVLGRLERRQGLKRRPLRLLAR